MIAGLKSYTDMDKQYKTFEDLDFESWLEKRYDNYTTATFLNLLDTYAGAIQACIDFPNGYGVSVLRGKMFYSDGFTTYEVAITKSDKLVYPKDICPDNDVLGYRTPEEVTEIMRRVQDL